MDAAIVSRFFNTATFGLFALVASAVVAARASELELARPSSFARRLSSDWPPIRAAALPE